MDKKTLSEIEDTLHMENHEFIWGNIMPLLELRSDYMYATYPAEVASLVLTDPYYKMLEAILLWHGSVIKMDRESFTETVMEIIEASYNKLPEENKDES